jgi:anaerobic selenocysteine-containing dehydrogenase
VFDLEPLVVDPGRPGSSARFEVMPGDVRDELEAFRSSSEDGGYRYRMTVRRMRHVMNSLDPAIPERSRTGRHNPAYLHPDDMSELGVAAGDPVEIVSDHDRITAIVAADERLRPGVVSISHCFGTLPGENDDPSSGACTNRLIDTSRHHQAINAMPTMSGLPVNVVPVRAG